MRRNSCTRMAIVCAAPARWICFHKRRTSSALRYSRGVESSPRVCCWFRCLRCRFFCVVWFFVFVLLCVGCVVVCVCFFCVVVCFFFVCVFLLFLFSVL